MAHANISGKEYRLAFNKGYPAPVGYYFRRDNSTEIIFYNLSPKKKLERILIETILEGEGATEIRGLGSAIKKTNRISTINEIYNVSVDPDTYEVSQLVRLEGMPRINGHVPQEILERVLREGSHIVNVSGKNIIKAKLVTPVGQDGIVFPSSPAIKTTQVVRGVGKGQDVGHAIQSAYFNAFDNALYL